MNQSQNISNTRQQAEESRKILHAAINQNPVILNWNFEELSTQLDTLLQKYREISFTNDRTADAKKIRSALIKTAKVINDRKNAVKNESCMQSTIFEKQVNTLIGKIKDACREIDAQIQSCEDHKRPLMKYDVGQINYAYGLRQERKTKRHEKKL